MPHAKVNGINLYYEVHGAGTPLVLIMGLRRNALWWYRQVPELSRHFRVIAFDNRGAGRTDKPAMEYSIGLFAEDTAALLSHLGVDAAHVLGISMGGYIAQELAINHPERVLGLILGCTSCGGERAVLMSEERMKKFTAIAGLTPRQILEKDMDIYFSDDYVRDNPEAIQEFIELSLEHYQPAEAFERQFAACLAHDTAHRLGRVRSPVLVAHGDDDPLVPTPNAMILHELLPGSTLRLYERGRHCFFMEFHEQFNKDVVSFLQSAEASR